MTLKTCLLCICPPWRGILGPHPTRRNQLRRCLERRADGLERKVSPCCLSPPPCRSLVSLRVPCLLLTETDRHTTPEPSVPRPTPREPVLISFQHPKFSTRQLALTLVALVPSRRAAAGKAGGRFQGDRVTPRKGALPAGSCPPWQTTLLLSSPIPLLILISQNLTARG